MVERAWSLPTLATGAFPHAFQEAASCPSPHSHPPHQLMTVSSSWGKRDTEALPLQQQHPGSGEPIALLPVPNSPLPPQAKQLCAAVWQGLLWGRRPQRPFFTAPPNQAVVHHWAGTAGLRARLGSEAVTEQCQLGWQWSHSKLILDGMWQRHSINCSNKVL